MPELKLKTDSVINFCASCHFNHRQPGADKEYENPAPLFWRGAGSVVARIRHAPGGRNPRGHLCAATGECRRRKLPATSGFTACRSRKSAGCARCIRVASARCGKSCSEIRPDIVHGQGTERDSALGAIFSGFPNVLTIHGNMRAVAEFYRARHRHFLLAGGPAGDAGVAKNGRACFAIRPIRNAWSPRRPNASGGCRMRCARRFLTNPWRLHAPRVRFC